MCLRILLVLMLESLLVRIKANDNDNDKYTKEEKNWAACATHIL